MKTFLFISILILAASLNAWPQKAVNYEVFALKFATSAKVSISTLVLNGPDKDSISMLFTFWLIKGNNGRNILLDAGFLDNIQDAKDFHVVYFARPDSLLMQTGLKPEAITDIILSHPHWDHINGISLFPNAQIWMQKEDYNYFVGEAWQKDGKHGGFNKDDVIKVVERNLAGKMTLVNGDDQEIIPGIRVYTGSRHTYNSQYVQVTTGADRIILASDNIWIYYNLDHLSPPPDYGTFDPKGYVMAMKRMKTLASENGLVIPGHDPAVFSKFHKVSENVVQIAGSGHNK